MPFNEAAVVGDIGSYKSCENQMVFEVLSQVAAGIDFFLGFKLSLLGNSDAKLTLLWLAGFWYAYKVD